MTDDRDLYSGMIRLHILHHAEKELIFGAGMAEELAHHGYKISPGTLYPILHGLEKRGYLKSSEERSGKSSRRVYSITPTGRRALKTAKKRVRELFGELIEDE
ncbi:PadR family transcriptional regulator [Terriglobus tenax]|uniref:PadR family transcriptional regulator n=1 Tax=Terriglobus tenax TaxID=1111115 RepID=UPI0021E0BD65|nr:PadR family transcriptional regulator [Terriglobus tenax]